jgi:hypothetical protein
LAATGTVGVRAVAGCPTTAGFGCGTVLATPSLCSPCWLGSSPPQSSWPTVALAADSTGALILAVDSIEQVVDRLRVWLVGILAAVATLFLTVGGLRYIPANGDPGEVEKAKSALKSAALGYGLALLAPLIVNIVRGFTA